LWWRISSHSSHARAANFGDAERNSLREYECDFFGAKRYLDLAGNERDVCDDYGFFRLDLAHGDDEFAGLRHGE
jgi:hypothetical protein